MDSVVDEKGESFEVLKKGLSHGLLQIDSPTVLVNTLLYSMSILAPIRICIESGIFRLLTAAAERAEGETQDSAKTTLSASELADSVVKDSQDTMNDDDDNEERTSFVTRIIRPLCALNFIEEVGPSVYRANDITKAFADEGLAAGFLLVFDGIMGPRSTMTEMLSYSKSARYRSPPSADDGPYQQARGIPGKSTFEHWTQREPEQLSRLSTFMQRVQGHRPHWTEWFPKEALFDSSPSQHRQFVFVDVGGGRGQDLAALAAQSPNSKVRFILQDLPSVLQEVDEAKSELDARIELSAYDFFQPQPVRDADFYYMRRIMHDWPDHECVKILQHLRDAMAVESSRILINEMILPDRGCPLLSAGFDITMLALHSGKERDESMWKALVGKIKGLEVKKFWHPPAGETEGIVEVIRRS